MLIAVPVEKANPDISVVQPAENWEAKNLPGPFDGTRERRILLQGEMRAGAIVIFHVRQQQVTEVALAEHNNVVEAFPSIEPIRRLHLGPAPARRRRPWRVSAVGARCRRDPQAGYDRPHARAISFRLRLRADRNREPDRARTVPRSLAAGPSRRRARMVRTPAPAARHPDAGRAGGATRRGDDGTDRSGVRRRFPVRPDTTRERRAGTGGDARGRRVTVHPDRVLVGRSRAGLSAKRGRVARGWRA